MNELITRVGIELLGQLKNHRVNLKNHWEIQYNPIISPTNTKHFTKNPKKSPTHPKIITNTFESTIAKYLSFLCLVIVLPKLIGADSKGLSRNHTSYVYARNTPISFSLYICQCIFDGQV